MNNPRSGRELLRDIAPKRQSDNASRFVFVIHIRASVIHFTQVAISTSYVAARDAFYSLPVLDTLIMLMLAMVLIWSS